jgi:3-hydroxybutyryl-CoA dehydrogenase
MVLDINRDDLTVGVIGCGVMGRGIAQIAAVAGCRVILVDSRAGAAIEAKAAIGTIFDKLASKGKMTAENAARAASCLTAATDMADLKNARIVIEAIIEQLDAKRALMRQLEQIVNPACLIATNTSSLSVTSIAAACADPGRVGGYHFFNPVPLMKVVEVIPGALTEDWVVTVLTELSQRLGHRPVRAKDTPGFIVNHAGRGYGTEALRLLGESVADVPMLDRILKQAAGFRMGPFELLDLTGLDVSHPVMESIYHQYYEEPRFRPSPLARQRLEAGLFGRKSQRGFYDYREDRTPAPVSDQETGPLPRSAHVADGPAQTEIAAIVAAAGVSLTDSTKAEICIAPLLGEDATTATLRLNLDPARTLGIDAIFGLQTHRTLVATPVTSRVMQAAALSLFAADGVPASVIKDSPGAVAQRVLATIINIACDIAQQRIANPADIDIAVTLGLGYPQGPLAWGDKIGAGNILLILERLLAITGDPRYRPSLWLRRRAQLGLSLLHEDS